MAYTDHIVVDGVQYDLRDKEAVSFAQQQTLTAVQQEQARENIGAGSAEDVDALKNGAADLETYVRGMSPLATLSGGVVAVSDAAPLDAEDVLVNIEPVQSGSGNPSPDNVRPIAGWTGAKVTRCGKNMFDPASTSKEWVSPTNVITTINGAKSMRIKAKGGDWITLSNKLASTSSNVLLIACLGESDVVLSRNVVASGETSITKQAPVGTVCAIVAFYSWVSAEDAQLEFGSTVTEYEPYAGETYSITFPSEAGTVYGGTLDVTTGTLTVDRAIFINSGNGGWIKSATTSIDRFVIDTGIPGVNSDDIISNEFNHGLTGNNTFYIDLLGVKGAVRVIVNYTQYGTTTLEGFKAFLNENPVQFLIKLATPVTYQLDPVAVALLRGNNTLWADTGDTTLAYRQDVGLLLEALLKPDETDMTADTNYAVNSFFTVGGTLYRATAAIATGETIVPGTNCIPTTIADQLTAIYAQL